MEKKNALSYIKFDAENFQTKKYLFEIDIKKILS